MADKLREIFGLISKRYRDMGDGSHAEVVDIGDRSGRELGQITIVDGEVVVTSGAIALLPSEAHAGQVGGATEIALDSYTRPANVTQYAAGDQVADATPSVLQFELPRIEGGTGVIIHAICVDSVNAAVKPNLRLYLFDTLPTVAADNDPWTPSDGDMINLLGYVEFSSWEQGLAGAAGNCASFATNLQIPFDCTDGVVYGLSVERGTYTPASGEVFTFKLGVLQD